MGREDADASPDHLLEDFVGDMWVGYLIGPPGGQRLLTWQELEQRRISHRDVRRHAADSLYAALDGIGIHGQPPALMLSFDGVESSALLAHRFWDDLERAVPGELVVGVPARDVVMFTGSESRSGLEKVRRAVDRVLFAGGPHLLSRDLLVRRDRCWQIWQAGPVAAPRDPAQPTPPVPRPRTPRSSAPAR